VIDKPVGPTSHDVVGKLRRLFSTKRVGHAGTLDPMATGVLVGLVGEATKLSTWLTLDDKEYVARVTFGRSTDSFDATGKTVEEAPVPDWLHAELAALSGITRQPVTLEVAESVAPRIGAALQHEQERTAQIPPAFSAIQKDGVRAYAAARKGRELDLDARDVVVRRLEIVGRADGAASVDVRLDVGKGYYVRSFARDLGETLGVPACLGALRRERSGPFDLAGAITLDELARLAPEERAAKLVPLRDVARAALPCVTLTDEGLRKARLGQRMGPEHFATEPPLEAPFAWLDPRGELISVGALKGESFAVLRNVVPAELPGEDADDDGRAMDDEVG